MCVCVCICVHMSLSFITVSSSVLEKRGHHPEWLAIRVNTMGYVCIAIMIRGTNT